MRSGRPFLFIQFFWIEEQFRGKGHGTALIEKIEEKRPGGSARVRSYLDTMSVQAPDFCTGHTGMKRSVRSTAIPAA